MEKIILAGGGHGHIKILKEMNGDFAKSFDITLISDYKRQYYSGMLPAFVEGIYSQDEISFNIPELCEDNNVKFVQDTILSIDDNNKMITTERASYNYDYLSLNLGSQSVKNIESDNSDLVYTKPIENIVNFKFYLDENLNNEKKTLILVGGGAAGVELAFAFDQAYPNLDVKLISSSEVLIPTFSKMAQRIIKDLFIKKDIGLKTGELVEKVEGNNLITNVANYNFDYLIIATGTTGPNVLYEGLESNEKNYLLVDDKLKASNSAIAMGDMVTLKSYPDLPKTGVFAIRQAPVLKNNFIKMIDSSADEKFEDFKPQKLYLQILNTGGKKALMNYGPLAYHGGLGWKIKNDIDKTYMSLDKKS